MFCDFPKYKHLKQTIFRGPGGTGSATSDSDTTEFQEFLVQSQAARDAALAAQAAAEAAASGVDIGVDAAAASASDAASSASAAATSASNAATSASSASSSASAAASSASDAAASAASINPADIVHISGTETITGAKTFSQTITGSITGNAGTATNGVVTTGSYADPAWITSLAGSKVSGNISGNAANVTGTVAIANGGTGASTAATALSNLGAYPASNPSGYTTNTGTVTSVAAGSYLTGGTITTSGTLAVDATSANTASKVVARDASGDFSAGTITASLSGNATSATTATTASTANALATGNNYQVNSLGVGTAASGTAGEIRATNNITAYYSDDNLKTRLGRIENALDKLCSLDGFYYEANETAQALGYEVHREVGVSAQQMQAVLPEIVVPAPIDEKYLTVRYERALPLIVEAIKELRAEVQALKGS